VILSSSLILTLVLKRCGKDQGESEDVTTGTVYTTITNTARIYRRYLAANGAIMRTSILGVLNFNGELIIIIVSYLVL
jgi:hypothetical protein